MMKPHFTTNVHISSPIQFHLNHMLFTIKHTLPPPAMTRATSTAQNQLLHGLILTPLSRWQSTEYNSMISNHQFQYLHTGQQQDTLHINYTANLVNHTSQQTFPKQTKMQVSPKKTKKNLFSSKDSVCFPSKFYNIRNQQRFDSRGVIDFQYRPTYFYIYPDP
jgi:hypothetical protein